MQKDIIVYFGIIQFNNNNAMCQHAEGIKSLIEEIGYKPIIVGTISGIKQDEYMMLDDCTYAIKDPQITVEKIKECFSSAVLKKIIEKIGVNRIKAFIMADFRYVPMKSMKRFCEANDINYVVDIMDRFAFGNSISSIIKKCDCDLRMRLLYPNVKRRIYICSSYVKLLGESDYTSVIPGVTRNRKSPIPYRSDDIIRLIFLGQPGIKCEKEKIDWVINAIAELNLSKKIEVYLAGFEKQEFITHNENLKPSLQNNIFFLGRLSHSECIALLEDSDFSLVIRPDTDLSRYGFSTKIGEAFSCGIPVLATNTSDNRMYIQNGVNGYICKCSYEDVKKMLLNVSLMTRPEIEELKEKCREDNPLHYSKFIQQFKKVVVNE